MFVSVSTLILIVIGRLDPGNRLGLPLAGLLDIILFAFVAIGVWRLSKIWSVIGLVLYLFEVDWNLSHGRTGSIVVTLLILYAFINGVRGTFAYHRLSRIGEQG